MKSKKKQPKFTEENIKALFKDADNIHKLIVDGLVMYSNDPKDLYYSESITTEELYDRTKIYYDDLKYISRTDIKETDKGMVVFVKHTLSDNFFK